jgi:hypothetical protein
VDQKQSKAMSTSLDNSTLFQSASPSSRLKLLMLFEEKSRDTIVLLFLEMGLADWEPTNVKK